MGNFTPIGQVKAGVHNVSAGSQTFTPISHVKAGVVPSVQTPAAPAPKQPHLGFLGTVGHIAGQAGTDLYSAAEHVPGGLKAVGSAVKHDLTPTSKHSYLLEKIIVPGAKAAWGDVEQAYHHPSDPHLGNLALDAFGVASAGTGFAARLGEAGKLAATAADDASRLGKAGAAAEGFLKGPKPGTRTITHEGVPVQVPASRSALTRAAQRKVIDPLKQRFPDVPVLGAAATVERQLGKDARGAKRVADSVPAAFVQRARAAGMLKRSPGKALVTYTPDALARQHALRVVAEGVPTTDRIAAHQGMLDRGYKTSAQANQEIAKLKEENFTKGHQEQIGLNQAADKYVHDVNGKPEIRPDHPEIQAAYQHALQTLGSREKVLDAIDALSPEAKAGRYSAPGRLFFGQGEDFTGGEARIPTVPAGKEPRSKSAVPQIGSQGVVNGTPDKIPSIYKPYLGGAYRGGKIRNDVVRLINEAHQEAQRYFTLVHVTDRLKGAAKDAPTSKYDIPIRMEKLPGGATLKEARAIAEQAHTDPGKLAAFSHAYESMRQQIFPDYTPGKNWQEAAQRAMGATEEAGVPGYKWVDSRLTGNLHQRNPLLGFYDHKVLRGSLRVVDGINNANKLAILYLKPAYIAPNLIGNVAMNLTQQGFAAPANLARAARLNAALDAATYQKVLASMGEGVTGSLESSGGLLSKATNAGAHFYGNLLGVDKYPRLAAFLYEARKLGYKTPDQLRSLFTESHQANLHEITARANKEIIDYGDLGAAEQAIVRRVIFFYPWVKGATKWSAGFVADHPTQAAIAGQLGRIGKQQQQAVLGTHLPSWAQGLIPTGVGKDGLPTTVNPNGISVLSTPADLMSGVLHGGAGQNLTPAFSLAHDAFTQGPAAAVKNQAQGFPLAAPLGVARPSKTFPHERDLLEALKLFGLGSGLARRETSVPALEKSWYREQHPRK